MNKEEEEKQKERDDEKKNKSSIVIKIPSYQEVLESSQSKTTSSLFTPSPSFSQAFSFVKSSQSYTPPPPATPPPPPPPSSRSPFHRLLGFLQLCIFFFIGKLGFWKFWLCFEIWMVPLFVSGKLSNWRLLLRLLLRLRCRGLLRVAMQFLWAIGRWVWFCNFFFHDIFC